MNFYERHYARTEPFFASINKSDIFNEDRLLACMILKLRNKSILSLQGVARFFFGALEVLLLKIGISLEALIERFLREKLNFKDEKIKWIKKSDDGMNECFDLLLETYKIVKNDIAPHFFRDFLSFLDNEAFKKLEDKYIMGGERTFKNERIREIQSIFDLSDSDTKFITLLMLNSDFPGCFRSIWRDLGDRAKLEFLSEALEIKLDEAANIIAENSRLFEFNIVRDRFRSKDPSDLSVNKNIENYIRGYTSCIKEEFYETKDVNFTYSLDSFNIDGTKIKIAVNMLKSGKPCKIFLYGVHGSGKTEFAKALSRVCSKKLVQPRFKSTSRDEKSRLAAAITCDYLVSKDSNLVSFFDECEEFLNNDPIGLGISKSSINNTLDRMLGTSIWICNYKGKMDPSTLRRFDFSIEFNGLSDKQIYKKIHEALLGTKFEDEICSNMLMPIVKKHRLNIAGINSMIRGADVAIRRFTNIEEVLKVMETIAAARADVLGEDNNYHSSRYNPDSRFDISVINTDVDCTKLVEMLRNYAQALDKNNVNGPMSLIFSGVPGSGKTEFAKYIAKSLKKDVILKKMSDLKSRYVGETERNIAEMFNEAESKKAILVIDEVDSIIRDRSAASYSWEVSESNEILAQMENFRGIFICSTNLLETLDPAVMRRFQKKVTFGYLNDAAKIKLFKKYFTPSVVKEPDGIVQEELCKLDLLTPGDFKNVAQQCEFDGTIHCELDYVTMLKREVSYKQEALKSKRRIGFI